MITAFNINSNNLEINEKVIIKNVLSTDTEPEIEPENIHNFFQNVNLLFKIKKRKNMIDTCMKDKIKSPFDSISDIIPSYEYDQRMIHKNQLIKKKREKTKNCKPLDLLDTNYNRFINYYEAFLYIAEHCQKNGQRFTKETCKEYLKKCYILDFAHDNFIPIMTHLIYLKPNKHRKSHFSLKESMFTLSKSEIFIE